MQSVSPKQQQRQAPLSQVHTAMSDQFHDNNGQLPESQQNLLGSRLNNWSSTQAVVDSSNPPSNQTTADHVSAPRPHDPFRDYVNKTCFNSFVSVVQNAPEKCLPVCGNILLAMVDAKKLIYLFERIRRHAVHRTLTKLDEVILFAVADMFTSESKVSSWYGPKLICRMLALGNHQVRYLILSLVLAAFRANMKLNMSVKPTTQFLAGLLVVLEDALKFMSRFRNTTDADPICLEKYDHVENQAVKLTSIRTEWCLFQRNPYLALSILRRIVWIDPIRCFINKHDGFQTTVISLLSNPMAPEDAFCECLCFAAKSRGFLGILDKKVPLGTVPQVVMHVAEYCMNKSGPLWSVPRFLTTENVSAETLKKTCEIAFAAVKSLAASIEQKSLYFDIFCNCIMRMYSTEALTDKGNTIGRAFGTLLSRFPFCLSLRDDFIVQHISAIHSCKDEIANLADDLLGVIISQYPHVMKKHEGAITRARGIRKLLQYSLDDKITYFPKLPHDWYP